MTTKCECHGPGFCERHGVRKSPHLHTLCRTRADYFAAWEAGRGPGQNLAGESEQAPVAGVGIELRKILGCGCSFHFGRLDEWGPERCLQEINSIVSDLVATMEKHREPISQAGAERMLRIAIERAGVTSTSHCQRT